MWIWTLLTHWGRNWLNAAKHECPPEEAAELRLDTLDVEIATLESKLSGENQRFGFCHNDLQYGNIMIDEETRSVTMIVSTLLYVQICGILLSMFCPYLLLRPLFDQEDFYWNSFCPDFQKGVSGRQSPSCPSPSKRKEKKEEEKLLRLTCLMWWGEFQIPSRFYWCEWFFF